MKKNLVWDNDVCSMFDYIKKNPTEFVDENEIADDEAWSIAYDEIERRLDDEEANLDIDKDSNIFVIGALQRWDGGRAVYHDCNTNNIGQAIKNAVSFFSGDNRFEVFVEGNKLLLSQTGHDNPVNPSILEFRVLKKAFRDIEDFTYDHVDTVSNLMRNSLSLAGDVRNVYGF